MFKRWAKLMGEDHWLVDPRFKSDIDRGENSLAISERMQAWCENFNCAEAISTLELARIPCAKVYAPAEILTDPHVLAGGFFRHQQYPGVAKDYPVMARLFRMSDSEVGPRSRAPTLGEHTEEILSQIGVGAEELAQLRGKRVVR